LRFVQAAIALLVCLTIASLANESAESHSQLSSSNPAADSLLAVPPAKVLLTFTEPVDLAAMTVSAVDEQGNAVTLGPPVFFEGHNQQIQVTSDEFAIGTYTISWTNRSSTDGHTLGGSFAFRVGGTDRAPAAATVEGQRPPLWAVITRWLTFLGIAPAVGLLFAAWNQRRGRLALTGALVATLATLLEPIMLTIAPPYAAEGGSLSEALRTEPSGWWIRLAGLTALIAILLLADQVDHVARTSIGATGLFALAGLALTSHAAGRDSLSPMAVAISFLHNSAVALWLGALILITARPIADCMRELLQFSSRAVVTFAIAVASGVLNAGFIFPDLGTLTTTDYGKVLLGKSALVLLVLGIAAFHHRLVRSRDQIRGHLLSRSVPAELVLAAAVIFLGATLAMLAPPKLVRGDLDRLDLAMPSQIEVTDDQIFVRLTVEPAKTGENALTVYATNGPPLTVETAADGSPQRVDHPPLASIQAISIRLESLDLPIEPRTIALIANGDGTFRSDGVNLSADGWWRATVSVRQAGVADDLTAEFILRTPDPNTSGFEQSRTDSSDPAAEAIFERARDQYAVSSWTVYTEALSGANGGAEISSQVWNNGGIWITTPSLQLIRLDGRRYFLDDSDVWRETDDSAPQGPVGLVQELEGATDFVLGRRETLNGNPVQVIHFYVPGTYLAPAYYSWWVNIETGNIEQIAMISRSHYMIARYDWQSEPAPVVPPDMTQRES
jgi:copper transport protein